MTEFYIVLGALIVVIILGNIGLARDKDEQIMIILVTICFSLLVAGFAATSRDVTLSRDVKKTEITLGEKDTFTASVKISYEGGVLKSVTLIPDTTKKQVN